jgi:antitoxin ParD1/3/4
MPTRNVVLTEHQAKLIENLVGSGRYQNASEVLREGLRLVEQREAEDRAKLQVLRKAAATGFDALDRGEFKEFDSSSDLQAYLNELSKKVISGRRRVVGSGRAKMARSPRRCRRA